MNQSKLRRYNAHYYGKTPIGSAQKKKLASRMRIKRKHDNIKLNSKHGIGVIFGKLTCFGFALGSTMQSDRRHGIRERHNDRMAKRDRRETNPTPQKERKWRNMFYYRLKTFTDKFLDEHLNSWRNSHQSRVHFNQVTLAMHFFQF